LTIECAECWLRIADGWVVVRVGFIDSRRRHRECHYREGHHAAYPDAWALTVALELSANEFIRELLPEGAVTLNCFPGFPRRESFAQRYHRLRRATRKQPALRRTPSPR
jgi:hypothetical protein